MLSFKVPQEPLIQSTSQIVGALKETCIVEFDTSWKWCFSCWVMLRMGPHYTWLIMSVRIFLSISLHLYSGFVCKISWFGSIDSLWEKNTISSSAVSSILYCTTVPHSKCIFVAPGQVFIVCVSFNTVVVFESTKSLLNILNRLCIETERRFFFLSLVLPFAVEWCSKHQPSYFGCSLVIDWHCLCHREEICRKYSLPLQRLR